MNTRLLKSISMALKCSINLLRESGKSSTRKLKLLPQSRTVSTFNQNLLTSSTTLSKSLFKNLLSRLTKINLKCSKCLESMMTHMSNHKNLKSHKFLNPYQKKMIRIHLKTQQYTILTILEISSLKRQ